MEWIERYVYDVTRRLPQSQREDVEKELKSLIADMLDERAGDGEVTESHIEEVLLELGNPAKLAKQYSGKNKYVIGPVLIDPYMTVLKISLLTMLIGMGIGFVIKVYTDPIHVIDHFVSFIVEAIVSSIPIGIGWVTLVFGLIEYFGNINEQKFPFQNDWKLADLPTLPDAKRQFNRSEPIAGIVFLILLFMMFSSKYFGIFAIHNGELATVIPFLNKETMLTSMPAIILILGFGILKEALKLVYGRWTKKLVLYSTIMNAISMAIVILMMIQSSFWNPNFMKELSQVYTISVGSDQYETIRMIWDTSTKLFVVSLLIGLVWDMISGFFKMRKSEM